MSELAYRMMLAAKKSAAATMPKLGDFVSFAHPVFGTPTGYIIMRISEAGQPARCEVIVRHGNTGWATYHWRRADELTVLANANRRTNATCATASGTRTSRPARPPDRLRRPERRFEAGERRRSPLVKSPLVDEI